MFESRDPAHAGMPHEVTVIKSQRFSTKARVVTASII